MPVDSSLPKSMAELLDRIEHEWSALVHAVESAAGAALEVAGPGGWSVKDHLAHITDWEQLMLRTHLHGERAHRVLQLDEAVLQRLDMDALNAVLQERSRGRRVEDVLAAFRRTHEQAMATLRQISFEELLVVRHPERADPEPLIEAVIGDTYEHYADHRAAIEALTTAASHATGNSSLRVDPPETQASAD